MVERANRVRELSTTVGTGTLNLDGALTGFQSFVAGIGNGNTCFYGITDGSDWEFGIGTVTDAAPDTLARNTVLSSSNGDALVSWSGVELQVYVTDSAKSHGIVSFNAQTGTTYTLVMSDIGKRVTMNNAASNVLTIPLNSAVAFPVGASMDVMMLGAGVTTVDGATGVTVNGVSGGGAAIDARYNAVSITKEATDTWLMVGAHGTVA